jgi:hypothetical protein
MRLRSIVYTTILGIVIGVVPVAVAQVPTCDPSIGASTLAIYAVYEAGWRTSHYYYLSTEVDTSIACSAGQSDRCRWGLVESLYVWYSGDYMLTGGPANFSTSMSCDQSEVSSTGKVGWGVWLPGQYKLVAVESCSGGSATAIALFTLN